MLRPQELRCSFCELTIRVGDDERQQWRDLLRRQDLCQGPERIATHRRWHSFRRDESGSMLACLCVEPERDAPRSPACPWGAVFDPGLPPWS